MVCPRTPISETSQRVDKLLEGLAAITRIGIAHSLETTIVKSARNIPGVVTTPASILSVYDILNAKYLVVDKDALAKIEEVYA